MKSLAKFTSMALVGAVSAIRLREDIPVDITGEQVAQDTRVLTEICINDNQGAYQKQYDIFEEYSRLQYGLTVEEMCEELV